MATAIQQNINIAADTAVHMAIAATAGYMSSLCVKVVTNINPLHGAIFCAVSSLVSKISSPFFEKHFASRGANESSKILGTVLNAVLSVTISAGIATACGFPVSLGAGFLLSVTMVALAALGKYLMASTGMTVGAFVK